MKMMNSTRVGAVPFAARTWRQSPSSFVVRVVASAAVIGALACAPDPAAAQFTQQGPKLVGSGAVGPVANKVLPSPFLATATPPSSAGRVTTRMPARRGSSRAATGCGPSRAASWSAPGRVGGRAGRLGRAFRRRQHRHHRRRRRQRAGRRGMGLHAQQRGVDASKAASWSAPARWAMATFQGTSVALSADGNTAIVGGPLTTRASARHGSSPAATGSWTQQGNKLVGTGAVGQSTTVARRLPSRFPPTATPPSWVGL